jgi:hypothetical protein
MFSILQQARMEDLPENRTLASDYMFEPVTAPRLTNEIAIPRLENAPCTTTSNSLQQRPPSSLETVLLFLDMVVSLLPA